MPAFVGLEERVCHVNSLEIFLMADGVFIHSAFIATYIATYICLLYKDVSLLVIVMNKYRFMNIEMLYHTKFIEIAH